MSAQVTQMQPLRFEPDAVNLQNDCPFFTILPAETRELMFTFALAPFEDSDPEAQFEDDTCFKRPGQGAPIKHDTSLLHTCRRIYSEAWYMPWTTREQVFYFAWNNRRPSCFDVGAQTVAAMQPTLNLVHQIHGDIELEGVRIFSQLCSIENGSNFRRVMHMQNFLPRRVTVTIRHTDWWEWEHDQVMFIGATWLSTKLPNSVREVRLEFESLERRKGQVDSLADQACAKWSFYRFDGIRMVARPEWYEVAQWTGSSTWEGKRWQEDERTDKPGVLDYYVKAISFRPTPRTDESPKTDNFQVNERPRLDAPAVGRRGSQNVRPKAQGAS